MWLYLLSLWMKPCVTIQMKAIEHYFHVVLFVFDKFILNLALLEVKGLNIHLNLQIAFSCLIPVL